MPASSSPFLSLVRLLRYASGHRRRIVAATVCSILNKVFDLAPPVLIGMAIDVVVEREESALGRWGVTELWDQLVVLAIATLVIWGLESLFEYFFAVLWRNLAQTIQHDLRVDAYRHVQDLDVAWFQERSTGGLLAILNDDVNQLERFLDGGANDLLQVGTTVVVVGITFFGVSPLIAVLAFLPVPFILVGSFRFQERIAPKYADVRERAAQLAGLLANNLGGIETIKSYTAEDRELDRVAAASRDYQGSNRAAIRLSSAFSPLIRMIIVLGFTATLVVGGLQVADGTLEVGAYSVLVYLTQRLLWPLTRLGATFDLYQRAMASAARVLDLLDTPTPADGDQSLDASGVRGAIVFDKVSFAYPGRDPVLRDVTIRIEPGQTVAVVGPTGSGKTTLVRLLLRFFEAAEGRVLLDGVDVRQLKRQDLRACVALVSQGVFLFSGSVADNVAYGDPGAERVAIGDALAAAEASEFVDTMPGGADAEVGERGERLSGGQRQRLSLARAVLKDAPILVLDEATSAVDNETEAAIQRSLVGISHQRTTLVIAHRLSTVRHADRIVVLEAGRVTEEGTHNELLARGGTYARLWSVQTGDSAIRALA